MVVTHLFVMALALSASRASARSRRRSAAPARHPDSSCPSPPRSPCPWRPARVAARPSGVVLPWFAVIAAAGAGTVLSYAILASTSPSRCPAAPTAPSSCNMRPAFGLQYAIRLHRRPVAGRRRTLPGRGLPGRARPQPRPAGRCLRCGSSGRNARPALHHLPAHPIHALATSLGLVPAAALSYARARHAWSLQMARARAQQQAWRTAAFASFAVLALLVSSLGSTVLGTSVAAPVIEGAQLTETRDFAGADSERSKPSFMLDRPAEVVPASLALAHSYGLDARREPW